MNLNKPFFYGICFASVTWAISLYLFWQLSKSASFDSLTPYSSISTQQEGLHDNSLSHGEYEKANHAKDNVLKKPNHNNYVNSEKLIKELQVVAQKPKGHDQVLTDLGMVKTLGDQKIRDEGHKIHAFNVLVSNKLSFHREIPDTRNNLCKDVVYSKDLPAASIIICFYNEHLPTLLRTIHSILDRTPSEYLEEIILIDDYSDLHDLHSNLTKYINENKEVKRRVTLLKTERREGLIRARMFGARKATGEALIFLDSHIEVNVGWIQPLLARIKENRTNVAIPVIDIINADTFTYTSSPLVRGGFNWGLHFKWENLPTGTLSKAKDFVKPIKSPTMAGGLFAMDRNYFVDLGEYDAGMDIWGGENLEISFRIWMCGGRLDIIPCSRVGHVFRHRRPYGDPDGKDTMLRNSLRVAHVWMDDYKDYFLQQRPDAKGLNYGDVTGRIALRRRLKCYDFDWYIKHVYPELALPSDNEERLKNKWAALEQDKFQPWHSRKRNYIDQYQLKLTNTSLCVQSNKDIKTKGSLLILRSCLRAKNQLWYETDKSELVLGQLLCLQSGQPSPYLYKCHEMGGNQEWKHKGENKTPVYNIAAGTCLGVDKPKIGAVIMMKLCTDPSLNMWDLVR
ncbi:hypothetical protein ILUMI_07277 [Ignelater luminosus]|uniref:Polypeptide N-acetylgalactosaminyltransferase n=1 Tax=Ignelater luminosus TaxID=2038154 RepID=A0A8K0D3U0_IGNLU|nr:hypothetical protein ILUMI_07277 [Ignelater luminosus]